MFDELDGLDEDDAEYIIPAEVPVKLDWVVVTVVILTLLSAAVIAWTLSTI